MACCCSSNKPLPEPMLTQTSSMTHRCATRPKYVNMVPAQNSNNPPPQYASPLQYYKFGQILQKMTVVFNSLKWRRNGCHIADDIFKYMSLNENFWLKLNLPEICSLGFHWQYGSIGSDNGLAPNRRQANIWNNVGMIYWHMYVSRGFNELTHSPFSDVVFLNV